MMFKELIKNFILTPFVENDQWNGKDWCIKSNLIVDFKGLLVTVPKYFKTDGASIPKAFRAFFNPMGKALRAAVVHDYIYRGHTTLTRKEADAIFYLLCLEDGVKKTKAKLMHRALRIFGSTNYKKRIN